MVRPTRRVQWAIGVASVLLLATVLSAFVLDAPAERAIDVASTTTIAAPTTPADPTTTIATAPTDPWATTIATANSPLLVVEEAPPEAFPRSAAVEAARAATVAAAARYSPERAGAPAIPRAGEAVVGRRRTPTGWELDSPTAFGGAAVVEVTEDHGDWLRVLLPVRPNGTEGWVRRSDVTLSTTTLHIEIRLAERKLILYDGPSEVFSAPAIVGKPATPTPTGRFYVTDTEKKYAGSAYGPWILPLSGFSQALDHFGGGAPALAIHGTNRPDLMGTAASNGCIRLPDDAITRLKDTVPMGTPVDIRG